MWTVQRYPAKKYMLVIWNHGQGWRFQMAKDETVRKAASSRMGLSEAETKTLKDAVPATPVVGGFRAVSFDSDTNHFLYNSDVQSAVEKAVTKLQRKLDIIGYDACLMSMIETIYAFRNTASLVVASEELEPAAGWDYQPIVRRLVNRPTMTGTDLANAIIAGYKARYGDVRHTTLSMVEPSKANDAAGAISRFADILNSKLETERAKLEAVRADMKPYGGGSGQNTSIDLIRFLDAYGNKTLDAETKLAADQAQEQVKRMVLANYASSPSSRDNGSKGIALYFPANKNDFIADPYHKGYIKTNTDHVVDFVQKERWADFLASYLR
jgi:hypothetical protein